jgi:hypothetical protein
MDEGESTRLLGTILKKVVKNSGVSRYTTAFLYLYLSIYPTPDANPRIPRPLVA